MSRVQALPSSVIGFLRNYVTSVDKLRLLLVLHGAPSRTIAVPTAATRLNVPPAELRSMAADLAAHGLLRISAAGLLELAAAALEDRLALLELATCYERDRAFVLAAAETLAKTA